MGYGVSFDLPGREFVNFQFPLWDTKLQVRTNNIQVDYFQFPLWDTGIFLGITPSAFALAFNSLYGIL